MELVVTGLAGFGGSRLIYENETCRAALLARYAPAFFACMTAENEGVQGEACSRFAALLLRGQENGFTESAAEGGVFAAMWRLLKAQRTGAVFSQRRIPICQQTVEICECFGLNPYRLSAPGCHVWLSGEADALLDAAAAAGIEAAVIGHTERGQAIRRTDGAETAYLRRPEPDELLKCLGAV